MHLRLQTNRKGKLAIPQATGLNALHPDHRQGSRANPVGSMPHSLTPNRVTSHSLLQLQRSIGNQAVGKILSQAAARNVIQRKLVAGIEVDQRTNMPTWTQDGITYHINLTTDTYHVTQEGIPKIQFFFAGTGTDIQDKRPTKAEQGRSKKKVGGNTVNTKRVFSELPAAVQTFIRTNWSEILG